MRMKGKVFLRIFMTAVFSITGCGSNHSEEKYTGDQMYAVEDDRQEDAVNTLQVGTKYKVTGTMDELRDTVYIMMGENYWPDTLLAEEELAERTGISSEMYEDYLAEYQHTEAGVDMMILIEARENKIDMVERYLNEYRELLLRIYSQQPQNRAKVSASRIEVIDNYVCYVQLGADISDLETQGEDVMISYCQQENEKALDRMEKKILNG